MSTLRDPTSAAASPGTVEGTPTRSTVPEQFIPLRKAELVDMLAGTPGLPEADSRSLRRLCRLIDVLVHCEFQSALEELKNAYAPFDPDADTRPPAGQSPARLAEMRDALFAKFAWLLARGNFMRLAQEEIARSLGDRSHWGLSLNLDFTIFERLEVYARGDVVGTRFRRRLAKRFRSEAVDVPIYQRLIVIFRLRPDQKFSKYLDTDDVHIKLFKDIPKADLDMLLPGTQVKMSLVDRLRILLPSLSGVVLGVLKIAAAITLTPYLVWVAVSGAVGYSARSVYGYLNMRQKYQLNLTQSLYFQNLDNNAGAIHRLLDEAEEQENREAVLAYFFLWRESSPAGMTTAELDRKIEAFLQAQARSAIDFEINDALEKLARMEIAMHDSDERWRALSIDKAIETLARRWTAMPE